MIDIDANFYDTLLELHEERGQLKEQQVYYSKGLAVIEKEQMRLADDDYRVKAQSKSGLSVQIQTRDARSSEPYKRAIKRLGAVEHRLAVVEGKLDIMDKKYNQSRTLEASRRSYG
jgi:hypothetical protein